MRLDYFLKISRLVKRRPLANEMCDKHLVQVNGQVAKASREVQVGDTLTIKFLHRTLTVRIDTVPEHAVNKAGSGELYTLLEDLPAPKETWA
jgi:ribosomal 50S subunit-recycling heat shock protein